jgi:predicted ATPase/DNA-binding winged helix-turn-helix (wHTH) protein
LTQIIGTYELQEVLGAGRRTTVYRGQHRVIPGLEAAIKVLHAHLSDLPEVREQMRARAGVLARLRHPRIVRVLDFIEEGPQCALVVELSGGRTLEAQLQESNPLALRQVLRVLRDLLEAVGHAHGQGIVHGELDPSAVLISDDGQIKLLDFGAGALGAAERTAEGSGTPRAARVDLIAIGQIAAALLLGRPPSPGPPSKGDLVRTGAPEAFIDLLLRLLQAHPTRSFTSCGEALGALERATGESVTRTVGKQISFPTAIVDLARQTVRRPRETLQLTTIERDLLVHLASHPGRVQSRELLMREVWGVRGSVISRAVDVAVRRLRTKVEEDPAKPQHILTVHGQGYRFEPPVDGLAESPTGSLRRLSEIRARADAAAKAQAALASRSDGPGSSFRGREADMDVLVRHFSSGARLVTLTGPGGIGKTRLSKVFAEEHPPDFLGDHPAWFCDLQSAHDLESMIVAVAGDLGAQLQQGGTDQDLEAVGVFIEDQADCLIIFDNFEQLADHAQTTLGKWMQASPRARFLVTSQARLGLPGERLVELQPLSQEDAIGLFVDRAQELQYDFEPTAADLSAIGGIADALDGIPLALELAASRIRMLGPAQLLERLAQRLDFLQDTGGSRPDRSATLRGAISWSWQLLDAHEQAALAQLAIFSGGFTADAAEAIIQLDGSPVGTLEILQRLVDRSLLRSRPIEDLPGERRFQCLETIRVFAAEQMAELVGLSALRQRYQDHYLQEGERLAGRLDSAAGGEAMRRLALELDNLLQLQREQESTDPEISMRAGMAATPVLLARGPVGVCARVIDAAVACSGAAAPEPRVRALLTRVRFQRDRRASKEQLTADLRAAEAIADTPRLEAMVEVEWVRALLISSGRMAEARVKLDAALTEARAGADPHLLISALRLRSKCGELEGDWAGAEADAREAIAESDANDLPGLKAGVLRILGVMLCNSGRLEEAEQVLHESLAIFDSFGDRRLVATCQIILADICLGVARLDECEQRLEDAQRISMALGNETSASLALSARGRVALENGDIAGARDKLQRSVPGLQLMVPALGFTQLYIGITWMLEGDHIRGAEILEQSLELMQPEVFMVGRHYALSVSALALCHCDRLEEAQARLEEGAAFMAQVEPPAKAAHAMACAVLQRALGGEGKAIGEAVPEELTLKNLKTRSAELRVFSRLYAQFD